MDGWSSRTGFQALGHGRQEENLELLGKLSPFLYEHIAFPGILKRNIGQRSIPRIEQRWKKVYEKGKGKQRMKLLKSVKVKQQVNNAVNKR